MARRVRATVAALAAAVQTAAAGAAPLPPFWQALAVCETGGRWDWGARHRHLEGRQYEGGLGFYAGTWRAWAGAVGVLHRYPHAYLAPARVQVRVGRYGLARGGYWGCLEQHPEIRRLGGR